MERTNDQMTAALMEPFPKDQIEERKVGGRRNASYVAGENVIRRLIEATGNRFDVSIVSLEQLPYRDRPVKDQSGKATGEFVKQELWVARVALEVPGLGRRESIGVQITDETSGEDMIKGVITDGVKKAATLFGVGLELYDDPAPNQGRQAAAAKASAPAVPTRDEWRKSVLDAIQGADKQSWARLVDQAKQNWQWQYLLLECDTPELVEWTFKKAEAAGFGEDQVVVIARRNRLEKIAAGTRHAVASK